MSRAGLGGLATGGTEGAEWSTFISGGYDFHFGHLTVGPIAALQYTYINIDGFSEKSSLAPMQIYSRSAESLRSDVGFRVFYQWQIGKIILEPSPTFFGTNEGHDSAVVSAGVSAQLTPGAGAALQLSSALLRSPTPSRGRARAWAFSF